MANGIYFGSSEMDDLKFGSSQVDKIYLGDVLVWRISTSGSTITIGEYERVMQLATTLEVMWCLNYLLTVVVLELNLQ